MPTRATKRGEERTPLSGQSDVLICGASFAGLAVARELAGSGARRAGVDRYEIGERQTSACGIPTEWLRVLGLEDSARQDSPPSSFTPRTAPAATSSRSPSPPSTTASSAGLLWEQSDARFETAKVEGRTGDVVHTDRGDLTAPLIVDALGWKRILANNGYQPPDAPSRAASRCTRRAAATTSRSGSTAATSPPDTAGRFPARDEQRIGVGSFDPRFHVKDTTVLLAEDLERPPVRYQGNWIPHKLRGATEDGIFFAGDSAGHCLPLTAEGIRTAFYFGIACGRELRAVYEGRKTRETAMRDYAEFNDSHEWKFRWMLRVQKLVPRLPARVQRAVIARDRAQALRALVLRPLPADRPARVRRAAGARAEPRARALRRRLALAAAELSDRELRLLRLRAQRLLPGSEAESVADAAGAAFTIQAQDPPAAALGGPSQDAWPDAGGRAGTGGGRDHVRAWLMRNTIHMFATADLGWMRPLLAERPLMQAHRRFEQLGVSSEEQERLLGLLRERVGQGPLPVPRPASS